MDERSVAARLSAGARDLSLLQSAQTGAQIYPAYHPFSVARDSAVGIPTRYGLDGPGIESRWRQDFQHLSILVLGPTQPPVQWVPGPSRG